MDAFHQIKLFFHNYYLQKQLKRQATLSRGIPYGKAKEIGIFFMADDLNQRNVVIKFADSLKKKGKKVTLLGYFDQPVSSTSFTFPYFTRKDTDWALRPNGKAVQDFLTKRFDVFIAAHTAPQYQADYLAAYSPAKLRVGPVTQLTECYELMVDTKKRDDLNNFLLQVVTLLEKTNPHHEEAA